MTAASIAVEGLAFARDRFRLGPLSFTLPPGARAAVVGPSGAGKSTLLRLLAGLETADAGRIQLGGRVVSDPRLRVAPERRRIGFVFQDGALWPHLDAAQHLTFVDPRLGRAGAETLLAQVGLGGAADRRPAQLSGGEGQRLALARALAGAPELLLLDEPLRSVDVHLRDELALLIRRVAAERGLTLLVVTHDRDEALALADTLLVLDRGRLVEQGKAAELLRAPQTAFAAAFLARAACLPARPIGGGCYETSFGRFDGQGDGERLLVLMPGDVALAPEGRNGVPRGRVLGPVGAPGQPWFAIELDGQTLRVASERELLPGETVAVELRGRPRLLPRGGEVAP